MCLLYFPTSCLLYYSHRPIFLLPELPHHKVCYNALVSFILSHRLLFLVIDNNKCSQDLIHFLTDGKIAWRHFIF